MIDAPSMFLRKDQSVYGHAPSNVVSLMKCSADVILMRMPWALERYHETGKSHFLTFSCFDRLPKLKDPRVRDLFLTCLEQTRKRFTLQIYGFVVMPEHVHLLISEPRQSPLATAIQSLKLAVTKRLHNIGTEHSVTPPLWHKRYYDHNVRSHESFTGKLRYIHNNPVKRGLVKAPEDWLWSSFRHYSLGEIGVVEIESEWTDQRRRGVKALDIISDKH